MEYMKVKVQNIQSSNIVCIESLTIYIGIFREGAIVETCMYIFFFIELTCRWRYVAC